MIEGPSFLGKPSASLYGLNGPSLLGGGRGFAPANAASPARATPTSTNMNAHRPLQLIPEPSFAGTRPWYGIPSSLSFLWFLCNLCENSVAVFLKGNTV